MDTSSCSRPAMAPSADRYLTSSSRAPAPARSRSRVRRTSKTTPTGGRGRKSYPGALASRLRQRPDARCRRLGRERAFRQQPAELAVLAELPDGDERVPLLDHVVWLGSRYGLRVAEDRDDRDARPL